MKNKEDLKGLTLDELNERLVESMDEYDNLHIQQATHQLSNPIRLRDVRRQIARIKTFIHQHEQSAVTDKSANA
jgi:large subunit ribosomal protein L29